MEIYPAYSVFRVRPGDPPGIKDGYTLTKKRSKRGRIKEFSEKSRKGLQFLAANLKEIVGKPDLMITLTYPGEWESVTTDWTCHCEASEGCSDVPCICDFSPSGKVVSNHLDVFQKRIERYFKRFGMTRHMWGCLWFLEFQKRGAPHVHLLFFNLTPARCAFPVELLKKWCSENWAEIVGHKDDFEFQKHLSAGTKVETYRASHFGYALKYATKMEQKSVPPEFANIGRFWGCWNKPKIKPVLRSFYAARFTFDILSDKLSQLVSKYSINFALKVYNTLYFSSKISTFTLTLFGSEVSKYLLSYGKPEPIALQC